MSTQPRIITLVIGIFFLSYAFAQDTSQQIVPYRFNSAAQQAKPYVILISADGFRHDLADKYHAGNLLRLRDAGIQSDYMQPSYPSLTFPNHYTIVTGLYPSHHGIVDNNFYDRNRRQSYSMGNKKAVADSSWYSGTPLWTLAEKQQMLAASFYWVASETAIQGIHQTYYYLYNEKIDIDTRIRTVKQWLQLPEEKRPHLITFYFSEVDHAEHRYGVDSKEAETAVHFVDESVGKMVAAVDSLHLPVNFIFLADHGMAMIDTKNWLSLPAEVDTSKFFFSSGSTSLNLFAKNKADILPTYNALKQHATDVDVYLADETPERWHFSAKDDKFNGRIGDIVLVAHAPKVFSLRGRAPEPATHGFDPALDDMHATFYAWGPAFKQHLKIPGFENVNVYPLVAKILGLTYDRSAIDGKIEVLAPALK